MMPQINGSHRPKAQAKSPIMYHDHFGLDGHPFMNTPDTRLFYTGGQRGAILDALEYAVDSGEGIIKVVGEVGSGKTMLCRMLESRLSKKVETVFLANPSLSPENIFHAIAVELRIPLPEQADRFTAMQALQDYLLEKHAAGRQVVILVEEAQGMPLATLEEIRLLSNLETSRSKLLQLVLFGQPELDKNLSVPAIRQLKERISYQFNLSPLTRNEVGEYLIHRMRGNGYRGPNPFHPRACQLIWHHSNGLTRRINLLADKSLLAAFIEKKNLVRSSHVRKAAAESTFTPMRNWRNIAIYLAVFGGLAIPAATWMGIRMAGGSGPGVAATAPPSVRPTQPSTRPPVPPQPAGMAESKPRARPILKPIPSAAAMAGPSPAQPIAARTPEPRPGTPTAATTAPPPAPSAVEASPAAAAIPAQPAQPDTATVPVLSAAAINRTDGQPTAEGGVTVNGKVFLRERVAAAEAWLAHARPEHFTVQLMLIHPDAGKGLNDLIAFHQPGEREIYIKPTLFRKRTHFTAYMNEYPSYSEAVAALNSLPPSLAGNGAFIQKIGRILAKR